MASEDNKYDNEVFIDADDGWGKETNSYEVLILNQMSNCVKVLSREMTGGQVVHKSGPTGVEKYIEDVRELVINHVDALKMLMTTYIKGDNKKQIEIILQEIKDYKDSIGEQKRVVPGKGIVAVKDFRGLNVTDPVWKEFVHYKAMRYREIFEILVNCYNEQKAYIRSLEEE